MKLAVMQPYFFPYVGYYQLACSVDEFVFFDDVNFIKKGYINRNAILLNGDRFDFSVPVSAVSQNRKISEHSYVGDFKNFLKQIQNSYKKAPFFSQVYGLIEQVVVDADLSVPTKNSKSIKAVFEYLGTGPKFSFASELEVPDEFRAQDRIIEICKKKRATEYHNSAGGRALYDSDVFRSNGIELRFVESRPVSYSQGAGNFVPYLSMIDVLMWNEKSRIVEILEGFDLA
jgi:hypothetical protein